MPFHLVNKLYNVDNTEVQYPITWSTFKSSVEKLFQEKNYEMVVHNHTFSTSGENTNISWTINISGLQDNLVDEEIIYFIPNRTYLVHITFQNTIINLDSSSGTSAFTMNYINPSVSGTSATFHLISQLQSDDEINVSSVYPYPVNTHSFSFTFTCPSVSGEQDNIQADAQLVMRNLVGLETSLSLFNYIIDITPPELTTVTLTHNNSDYINAKSDTIISLTITPSEPIEEPLINFYISEITYNPTTLSTSGGDWVATYTVQNGQNGLVSFHVAYSDIAGNAGVNVSSTTDNSSFIVDTTHPTMNATIITNNTNDTSLAKEGDVITLTMTPNETTISPTISLTIGSDTVQANKITVTASGTDWIATYIVEDNTNGSVSFTVDYEDLAGNSGISINQSSSITVDTTPPAMNNVVIETNNTNDTSLAKEGDVITLTMTPTETIASPTVSLTIGSDSVQANKITVAASGTDWIATYTVEDNTNGSVSFTVDYEDLAGNSGISINQSSSITVDTTPPAMNNVVIETNNTNDTSLAKEGDVITLTMTPTETIASPTVSLTIGSDSVQANKITVAASGTDWIATYTVEDNTNGLLSFTVNFNDLAGNTNSTVTTTNNSSVTVKTLIPQLTEYSLLNANGSNYLLENIYITEGDIVELFVTFDCDVDINSINFLLPNGVLSNTTEGSSIFNLSNELTLPSDGFSSSGTWEYTVQTNDVHIVFDLLNINDRVGNTNTETVPPDIFLEVKYSLNSTSPDNVYAKEGSVVTLYIETEVGIQKPVVIIALDEINPDNITKVNNDSKKWSVSYTVPSPVNDIPRQGLAELLIRTTEEINTTNRNVKRTADNNLHIDTISATLESLTISSNNVNSSGVATSGDTITLTVNANEAIQSPSGTWNSSSLTFIQNVSDTSIWTTELIPENSSPQGEVEFTITYFDLAGNEGIYNQGNLELNHNDLTSSNVIIDTIPPKALMFYRKQESDHAYASYWYEILFSENLHPSNDMSLTFLSYQNSVQNNIEISPILQNNKLSWYRFSSSHTSNKPIINANNITDESTNSFNVSGMSRVSYPITASLEDLYSVQYYGSTTFSEPNTTYKIEHQLHIYGDLTISIDTNTKIQFSFLKLEPTTNDPITMQLIEPFTL